MTWSLLLFCSYQAVVVVVVVDDVVDVVEDVVVDDVVDEVVLEVVVVVVVVVQSETPRSRNTSTSRPAARQLVRVRPLT
jgi:hypothetical protein